MAMATSGSRIELPPHDFEPPAGYYTAVVAVNRNNHVVLIPIESKHDVVLTDLKMQDRIDDKLLVGSDWRYCWRWTGALGTNGYHRLTHSLGARGSYRTLYVHRLMWVRYRGPLPERVWEKGRWNTVQTDHLCHTLDESCLGRKTSGCEHTGCVSPWHLELVTPEENSRRARGGAWESMRTQCSRGHEYTPETVVMRRRGDREWRDCRLCCRIRNGRKATAVAA